MKKIILLLLITILISGCVKFTKKEYNEPIITTPPQIDEIDYCQNDSDCKTLFSHCSCSYNCVNINVVVGDCTSKCFGDWGPEPVCKCLFNRCQISK